MRNQKHRRSPNYSAAESRQLTPGDIVVMTGYIDLESSHYGSSAGTRKFFIKAGHHAWGTQSETITATYMGQTRTCLLGLPHDLIPEGLRGGMGQGRKSRTLIMVHTFMTATGDMVIADVGACVSAV